jgi:hypothetical protein
MNGKQAEEVICTPAICVEKWKSVHEKLDQMHEDFAELRRVVTNGLSDRLKRIEIERELEHQETELRRKHWARWETAVVTLICGALATGVLVVAKVYFDQQTNVTRRLLEKEIRDATP